MDGDAARTRGRERLESSKDSASWPVRYLFDLPCAMSCLHKRCVAVNNLEVEWNCLPRTPVAYAMPLVFGHQGTGIARDRIVWRVTLRGLRFVVGRRARKEAPTKSCVARGWGVELNLTVVPYRTFAILQATKTHPGYTGRPVWDRTNTYSSINIPSSRGYCNGPNSCNQPCRELKSIRHADDA